MSVYGTLIWVVSKIINDRLKVMGFLLVEMVLPANKTGRIKNTETREGIGIQTNIKDSIETKQRRRNRHLRRISSQR